MTGEAPPARAPQAFVVAIAAQPGAGKSAVAEQLAAGVPGSCIVRYDDLQTVTGMSIAELTAWEAAGGDCNRFDLAALERELERRKRSDATLVIFETPLGRSHRGTARFIDRLVWLDTPFDVALARAIGKIIAERGRAGVPAADTQRWLASYLATYQQVLWRLYRRQFEDVTGAADLRVSGMDPPRAIAGAILRDLRRCGVLPVVNGDPGIE